MDIKNIKQVLTELYFAQFNKQPEQIKMLPKSGSDRVYFRIRNKNKSVIGAYNSDIKENIAFYSFSSTFKTNNINVPDVICISDDQKHYLIEDLGDESLFHLIDENKKTKTNKSLLCLLKESLKSLMQIQLIGGKHIDFSNAYPSEFYDKQSMMWDLNYFKYEFLKLAGIPFNEQALEDDFNTLTNYLLKANSEYFMYRDFQTRNIMIVNESPWFIDYQGGRKGALQYDVASLLYSPKTKLNPIQQDVLLDYYITHLSENINLDKALFKKHYYGFVLIRILQAFGAYGFRGLFEKKANFRTSIPSAISNLNRLIEQNLLAIELPEINKIAKFLSKSKWNQPYIIDKDKLTLCITSFSYKNRIPEDLSENGGGFVFDCRGLPNPGRLEKYRSLSGKDQSVIDYLEEYDEVKTFQNHVRSILSISLNEYINRGFNHLCVNFGCTGGQHRSVYNAEKFSRWIENNYRVKVVLVHREKENWHKND